MRMITMSKPASKPLLAPTISVVIPHLNQPQMLARCLKSLADNTRQPNEIIVVDNGSATLPDVPAHVTLLQEKTPGPGPARNLGVAHATGNVLAFIDADCLARFDWLEEAEKAIENAEILGGDVRIAYANPRKLTVLEAYESIYAYQMRRYIAEEGFTGTGNLVVRRDVLDKVGPFAGLSVAEDKDWGQRATRMGHSITYVPQMRIYHPARRTFLELYAKWDRQLAHEFSMIGGFGGKVKWLAKTAVMAVSPFAEIPRIAASPRVPNQVARFKAFAGLCRIRLYRAGRMLELTLRGRPERLSARWNRE